MALTMHIQLLCRLNRPGEACRFLAALEPLEAVAAGEERFHIAHARALFCYTSGDQPQAQAYWTTIIERAEEWGLPEHMTIGALHWLGLSLVRLGDAALASKLFQRSLALAQREPRPIARWVARNQLQLAMLEIGQGAVRRAEQRIAAARALVAETDREQRAHLRRVEAWLCKAKGDRLAAMGAYNEARDLFARMGLLHALADDDLSFERV